MESARSVAQARNRLAPLEMLLGQKRRALMNACPRQRVSMQSFDGVGEPAPVDLREVADRAPGSHEILVSLQGAEAELAKLAVYVLLEPPHLARARGVVHEEALAQTQSAEPQARRADAPAIAEARDLEAPAAEVEQPSVPDGEAVHCAEQAEARFVFTVDRLEGEAQLLASPRDEAWAVDRVTDRRGRDGQGAADATARCDGEKVLQGIQGALDRRLTEDVTGSDVAYQAQRSAGARQDAQMARPIDLVDDHASRVGADVDDGDRTAERPPGLHSPGELCCRPPRPSRSDAC